VPTKQPNRRIAWLGDGSCIRLRPTHRNHVWSYDFVMDCTAEGRAFRMLTIVDEFKKECLAIDVARFLTSEHVLLTTSPPTIGTTSPRRGCGNGSSGLA
jgi:putative transposase